MMAENSSVALAVINAEIQWLEEEIAETKLLHENISYVHGLAGDVLQKLQNSSRSRYTSNYQPSTTPQSPSSLNGRSIGNRQCLCSPNFNCQSACIPPGAYQQMSSSKADSAGGGSSNLTSGTHPSTAASGNDPNTGSSFGSTVAELQINANLSDLGSSSFAPTSSYGSAPDSQNLSYTNNSHYTTNPSVYSESRSGYNPVFPAHDFQPHQQRYSLYQQPQPYSYSQQNNTYPNC